MKLSFVIPAFNEEKNIGRCLESIFKEKNGKDYNIEIIVVNNASTDRTKKIAQSFPGVKVIDEQCKGIVWARRAGYIAAKGDLIANIDADNFLSPCWIDKVLYQFKNNPRLLALSGPYTYYDFSLFRSLLVKIYYFAGKIIYLLTRCFFHSGVMLQGGNYVIKKSALKKIGGYDTSIKFYGEDTDIACRVSKLGQVKFTFGLTMFSSARRLKEEGLIKMTLRYSLNYLWMIIFKKPFSKEYQDIRA
jgi:glycosyltransferase involved in cell wall biosynthesis